MRVFKVPIIALITYCFMSCAALATTRPYAGEEITTSDITRSIAGILVKKRYKIALKEGETRMLEIRAEQEAMLSHLAAVAEVPEEKDRIAVLMGYFKSMMGRSEADAIRGEDEKAKVAAAKAAYTEGPLGSKVFTQYRIWVYPDSAAEYLQEFKDSKKYRLTEHDFEMATVQARTFTNFLVGQSGNALLDLFAQPEALRMVIQKSRDLASMVKDKFFGSFTLGGLSFFEESLKCFRNTIVLLQFFEHHSDELRPKRNLNLMRAIFQHVRLLYLHKKPFSKSNDVLDHYFGLKPTTVLCMTKPSDWNLENEEICLSICGVFWILLCAYASFSPDEKQDLVDALLTHEEKLRLDLQMAVELKKRS